MSCGSWRTAPLSECVWGRGEVVGVFVGGGGGVSVCVCVCVCIVGEWVGGWGGR